MTRHALAAAIAALFIGCGADEHGGSAPNADGGGSNAFADCVDRDRDGFGVGCASGPDCNDDDPSTTNECYRCATPDDGCPCTTEGTTVACGKIESKTADDRVVCMYGERLCKSGTWSACAPSEILDKKTLHTKGLGGPTGCVNPCDPYCKSFPDVPDDSLSDDAGVVGSEAGIGVIPTVVDAGPPTTCASTTAEAKPIPLDLAVMFDKSGSMAGTRWSSATTALANYAASPAAKGVGMALSFFPEEKTVSTTCCFFAWCWSCTDTATACDAADYAAFRVGMGVLPGSLSGHAVTIRDALLAEAPDSGTPTEPALAGAIRFASGWEAANPTHKTVVILATDGEPNGCSSTVASTAAVASAGLAGAPSIPTYVIGVGPSLANLDTIARAGSGGTESYIPVASGDTTAFASAMARIQAKATSCDFTLPSPATGDVDPSATDVQVKNGTTGATSVLTRQTDKAACGTGDGYYYDNPAAPTRLTLCPSTCSTVNATAALKVEVVFKCRATCGKGAFKADPVPIAMDIMLDKSGSMAGARWTNVTNALKTFINDPSTDGVAIGLDYFPQTAPDTDYCKDLNYETPSVAIGVLPGNRTALISSINATSPSGNTPTEPALRGSIRYTRTFAVANPTYKPVVVLATDGEPTQCNAATNNPVWIGDNVAYNFGYLGAPSIPTYVIGVGSGVSATNLTYIANRGGTTSAYMVNDGSATEFLTAMRDIRRRTLSCEFTIPSTSLGVLDPATVNVRYPLDSGSVAKLPHVAGASSCGAGGGFYFDNDAAPTKIFVCPASCTELNSQSSSQLYVFYDCKAGGDGTFTRDYQIDCPVGTVPSWSYWSWNGDTPGDAEIDFYVASGNTLAELMSTTPVPLRFTNPPGPSSLVGAPVQVRDTPMNTQVGAAFVDTTLGLAGLPRHTKFLRVQARMKGTVNAPLLHKWNQEVSCVPAE